MKTKIFLLSDFHYYDELDLTAKETAIINAINSEIDENCFISIVLNGDIANRGQKKEFQKCESFLNRLKDHLETKNSLYCFILNCGNHDLNFDALSKEEKVKRVQIINKSDFEINNDIILKPFNNFIDFKSKYTSPYLEIVDSNIYCTVYKIRCAGHTVNFYMFNSTLFYDNNSKVNNLKLNSDFVQKNMFFKEQEINIFCSHYPLEWFNREKKVFYSVLENKYDFLITSHEHNSNIRNIDEKKNIRLNSINDESQKAYSSFHLINIDTVTTECSISEFIYNGSLYAKKDKGECRSLKKTIHLDDSITEIDSKEYNDILRKNILPFNANKFESLNDMFIKPFLSRATVEEDRIEEYIDFDQIDLYSNDCLVFTGGERNGKTFILRKLFLEYYTNGYLPIIVDIKKRYSNIEEIIKRNVKKVYGCDDSYDFFVQNGRKAILLFDNINNDNLFLEKLVELKKKYYKIIMTFNTRVKEYKSISGVPDVNRYNINAFKNTQKYEAIKKWIDNSKAIENKDASISEVKKILDKSLNFSNISTPEMVWIFLIAFDEHQQKNLVDGSKGVYYDYLFSKYILKISQKAEITDYNFVDSFLCAYCYFIKRENNYNIEKFHKFYLNTFEIQEETYYNWARKIQDAIREERLIDDDNSFCNPYVVPYFCAKYYSTYYEKCKDDVAKLFSDLHNNDSANTLLFLAKFEKRDNIVEEIIKKNDELFADVDFIKIEEDVKLYNSLLGHIKKVKAVGKVRENNEIMYKKIDSVPQPQYNERELTKVEKDLISSVNINDISRELLVQSFDKEQVRKLATSMYSMGMRRARVFIDYCHYALFNLLKKRGTLPDEELLKELDNSAKEYIVSTAILVYIICDSWFPKKYYYLLREIAGNSSIASNIVCAINKMVEYRTNESEPFDYDILVKLSDSLTKEKNKFGLLVLNGALSQEINYVGMNEKVKNKLLNKLNKGYQVPDKNNIKESINDRAKNRKLIKSNTLIGENKN